MSKRIAFVFFVLSVGAWLTGPAQADIISVPNGDFLLPAVPSTPGYLLGAPTSWNATSPTTAGVSILANPPSGQYAFVDFAKNASEFLYQPSIGSNFVLGDTYKLDFDFANGSADNPYTLKASIIYAGGTAMVTEYIGVLGSQGWTHGSVSGIATELQTGAIGIVFEFVAGDTSGNQGYVDNVTLTQTPEPGTLMLLTAGLIGLLAYAWRKRR